jgi:hypothetical protein
VQAVSVVQPGTDVGGTAYLILGSPTGAQPARNN